MREPFEDAIATLDANLRPGEDYTAWWASEDTLFARWSQGKARQVGGVVQAELTVRLIRGRRHAAVLLDVGAGQAADGDRIRAALAKLRQQLELVPEDPHLLWNQDGALHIEEDALAARDDGSEGLERIGRAAAGADLVGILAAGRVARGFASSRGARCWQARDSVHLDYSLVAEADRAVKSSVAGPSWAALPLEEDIDRARRRLAWLALPPQSLPRGPCRAWLEPAAVGELLGLMGWGGFSAGARQTRSSPLQRLADGAARLHPAVHLRDAPGEGLSPRFGPDGFVRPASLALVAAGRGADALVAARTAAEYGLAPTGAGEDETPDSLAMSPGELAVDAVAATLGDGVWISNLWYLNWSDRNAARVTGMTRFATMVVRGGEVVGPLAPPMRFDDTIYHLLGDGLVGLGREAVLLPDAGSYERRSTASTRAPAALVEGLALTL